MPPTESLETAPDPVIDAPIFSEVGGERARWQGTHWFEIGVLAAVAILARVVLWLLQPVAWWFPDTGDYIDTFGWKPHSNNRGPALAWLWHVGGLLNYTERNVVLLQAVLGVISVILLYDLLRRIVSRRRAFVAALVWSVFPLALVFERTLMPESPCASLLIVSLWLATIGFCAPWERWKVIPLVGATFTLSLVALIISSLELGCAAVAVLFLVIAWRRTAGRRGSLRGLVARGSLLLAMVVAFAVPAAAVAAENQQAFGTLALHPVSGTYLFAHWAPLVSCRQENGLTRLARGSVHQLCGEPFTSLPGYNTQDIWDRGTPINRSLGERPDFGATQSQLTHLAEQAMLAHPGAVIWQVSKSFFYQLVMTPFNDIWQYSNGYGWWKAARRDSHGASLAAWEHWWGNDAPRAQSRVPLFQSITQLSYRWPQYLLWVLFLSLLIRAATWMLARARRLSPGSTNVTAGPRPSPAGGSWRAQPRLTVVVASSIMIVGSSLSIAVAAFPVFRYPLTVVPAMLVLLAVAVPSFNRTATVIRRGRRAAPPGR